MHYEEMSTGKKVCYSIAAWLLLLISLGAVWGLNYKTKDYTGDFLPSILKNSYAVDSVNTLMVLITALMIVGISETMTGLKRHLSERVMTMALAISMIIALDFNFEDSLTWDPDIFVYLYGMVAVLIFMWAYIRELPYDCFGSKEPLFFVTLWIIPIGLAVGFSNRSVGLVMFIFAIAATIYVSKVDHRVFAWMPLGAMSVFLGLVARVVYPALPEMDWAEIIDIYDSPLELLRYGLNLITGVAQLLLPAILVTLAVVALLKGVHNVILGREVVYVLGAAFGIWLFSFFIPYCEEIPVYHIVVLLILACAAMCLKMFEKRPAMKVYIYMGCAVLWLRAAYLIADELFL